ncbi:GlcG/HbpS family heme-binding protein [Larsenimonas suaedae]|uniref:Heme-binding protein n=1 Tax=Larsenimonas suaedae TaxID=1851019 RepID=A0ABU1GSN1_9GAMM|nr:heme-binding protein [Larsenimonas suaedae]MCM2972183.1 heme-binding protein [Larsenimonas suaedae]MDR5895021.1 heme-binding protein [Larsenimonas suaedae]
MSDQVVQTYPTISLSAAEAVLDAATDAADEQNVHVSIAVVDRGGHLVAFRRMDGGVSGGVDGALGKAVSCSKFESSMVEFSEKAREQSWIGDLPGMIPLGGAEPLKLEDELVGAVAVSGADEPEEQVVAEAAVQAFHAQG